MDIEKMRGEAREFASFRAAKIEQGQAVMAARNILEGDVFSRILMDKPETDERRAERLRLEELRPRLEEQARNEHRIRFTPLQYILRPYEAPVREMRDAYFPEAKITVVDHYDNSYVDKGGDNIFYRGLTLTDNGGYADEGKRLFGVYAVAIESPTWETIYAIDTSVTYQKTVPQDASEDMQLVTPDEDLFVVQGERFIFRKSVNTPDYHKIRGKKRLEYQIGPEGLLVPRKPDPHALSQSQDPESFIETQFLDILKTIEVDNLLVTRGIDYHSQFLH